jgi:hypothetical protein
MPWSNWHRFSQLTKNPAESCKVGVYQVRATSADGQPVSIRRACADDSDGILYIGCGYLPSRIGLLLRIFEPNPKFHHNFIWVFETFSLERICDRRFLEFRWIECDEYALEERRLLDEYKKRTGDIPPGNRKLEPFAAPVPGADIEET